MRNLIYVGSIISATATGVAAAEQGIASYYQNPHYSGLIAAHKSLPFGSLVKVVNLDNGRSVMLKIVDRGPFIRGRVIDVSTFAADVLGFRQAGVARVRIETTHVSAPL